MKKTLLVFAFALATTAAWAQEGQAVDGLMLKYNESDKTATVVQWLVDGDDGRKYNYYEGDIVIPKNVNGYTITAIGDYAFSRLTLKDSERGITSVSIPTTVKAIGEWAFYRCDRLKSITIPNTVESIGDMAFVGAGIEAFTIEDGDSPLSVGGSGGTWGSALATMENCKTMYIGRTIKRMGTKLYTDYWPTFNACDNITDLTYGPKVKNIMANECSRSKSIKRVKFLGDLVTVIPESAFESSEVVSIELPSKLQTIEKDAFYKAKLESVNLPGTLTTIGKEAFYDNPMTSIVIPASVTTIGDWAFGYCPFTVVKSLATVPPVCSGDPFYQLDKKACKLIVPKGSLEAYKTANVWKDFFNIEATSLNDITTDGETREYFDLQGHNSNQPRKGLNIIRQGGKTRKVVIR